MKTKIMLSIMFLMFLLMVASVQAISINAPAEISDQSILYFNVSLGVADASSETKVFLDNKLMVTVYSDQTVVKHAKNVLDAFTLDSDPASAAGLKLYVVLIGLETGSHLLKATSAGEDTTTVNVYSALTESFKNETESKLEELESDTGSLSDRLSSQETANLDQASQITSLSGEVSSTKSSLDSLKQETDSKFGSLEGVPGQVDELDDKLAVEMQKIEDLEDEQRTRIADLEEELKTKIDNPLTGFASMEAGSSNNLLLPLVGLLIIIVIGFVFVNRSKFFSSKETIYSKEPEEDEEEISPEEEKEIEEAVEQKRQGKWAFKDREGDEDAEEDDGEEGKGKPVLSSLSSLLKRD